MSQYGLIPIERVGELQEVYHIATPATWTTWKDDIQYGGVEDWEFSQAQIDEIESLGGMWFIDAAAYLEWFNN